MNRQTLGAGRLCCGIICSVIVGAGCFAEDKDNADARKTRYRGMLGSASNKIRTEGDKTYVWAGGDRSGPGARWYDFTGSLIPAAELQFGIGKDAISSIDDPLFVKPDDPRLLNFGTSPYRREDKAKTVDDIQIIGFADGDDVRAYPIGLLDQHELVNDKIGGKPVVVGW